jgi:putative DNA-invertase from lambdoid prophage Rac
MPAPRTSKPPFFLEAQHPIRFADEISPAFAKEFFDLPRQSARLYFYSSAWSKPELDADLVWADQVVAPVRTFFDICDPTTELFARPEFGQLWPRLTNAKRLVCPSLKVLGANPAQISAALHKLTTRRVQVHFASLKLERANRTVLRAIRDLAEQFDAAHSNVVRGGLASALKRGTRLGRKPLLDPTQVAKAALLQTRGDSLVSIARSLGVSARTVARHLEALEERTE